MNKNKLAADAPPFKINRKQERKMKALARRKEEPVVKTVGILKSFTRVRLSTFKKRNKDEPTST